MGEYTPEQWRAYKLRREERAPKIECACGCGELIPSIRYNGSPRKYASRDHWREMEARNATSQQAYSRRARKHLKDACERCGATEDLHAHHIDKDRSNNGAENIESLCKRCHRAHHDRERYGAPSRP